MAVAIDGRYHGARAPGGKADYAAAILRAYRTGREHPFFDSVWDVMRLLDWLQTRADVDPARVGLIGISKGGIETYLTAAVDPRIAVAVPCISVESFRWADERFVAFPRIGTIRAHYDQAAQDAGVAEADGAFVPPSTSGWPPASTASSTNPSPGPADRAAPPGHQRRLRSAGRPARPRRNPGRRGRCLS